MSASVDAVEGGEEFDFKAKGRYALLLPLLFELNLRMYALLLLLTRRLAYWDVGGVRADAEEDSELQDFHFGYLGITGRGIIWKNEVSAKN